MDLHEEQEHSFELELQAYEEDLSEEKKKS